MLGKLLKYEFKSEGRVIPILWAAVIVLSALYSLFAAKSTSAAEGASVSVLLIYILILIVMIVLAAVNIIVRFYRGMISDQAYLTHMLPAKPWEHIISRLISALVWMAASLAVAFLSIIIISGILSGNADTDILSYLGVSSIRINVSRAQIFLGGATMAASLIRVILQAYMAILMGGLADKHRIFYAVCAYILFAADVLVMYTIWGLSGTTAYMQDTGGALITYSTYTVKDLLGEIIFAVIFFLMSRELLLKRVNLV